MRPNLKLVDRDGRDDRRERRRTRRRAAALAAALHHLRFGRRRQVHAARPPAVRDGLRLRRPARGAEPRQRALRHDRRGCRFRAAGRRPVGRTRTGHHDRRRLSLFLDAKRAFIAADTPGHEQYTRNMATGASTADVAIILVDARKGLLPQTRRHSYIVSMLGVRRVIVAINKIDLVGYDEQVFRKIEQDYRALAADARLRRDAYHPGVGALRRQCRRKASDKTPWRKGRSLLALLETIEAAPSGDAEFRLPVQWVNRPNLDFRGFSGTIAVGRNRRRRRRSSRCRAESRRRYPAFSGPVRSAGARGRRARRSR